MACSGVSNSPFVLFLFAVANTCATQLPEAPVQLFSQSAEVHFPEKHPEASKLNRYNFAGNVLHGTGDRVKHWVVIFCTDWHERCQGLVPSYELLGAQWEEKLNAGNLFESSVRFAKVDCAIDKALCNSQNVEDYPTVMHYMHGEPTSHWTGGAPGLVRWVKQALTGQRPKQSRRTGPDRVHAVKDLEGPTVGVPGKVHNPDSVGAATSSCSAEKREVSHDAADFPSAQPERTIFTAITGLLLVFALGIGHLSTPQLFGQRPQTPAMTSAPSSTVSTASSAGDAVLLAKRNTERLHRCIPEERVNERKGIEL